MRLLPRLVGIVHLLLNVMGLHLVMARLRAMEVSCFHFWLLRGRITNAGGRASRLYLPYSRANLLKHEGDLRVDPIARKLVALDGRLEILDVDRFNVANRFCGIRNRLLRGILSALIRVGQNFDDFQHRHDFTPLRSHSCKRHVKKGLMECPKPLFTLQLALILIFFSAL